MPGSAPFFTLTAQSGAARAGILHTAHGDVPTPVFMPVGTQATVKGLDVSDLVQAKVPALLANAYHLYLRPGHELIRSMGGLHRFMAWDGAILTDSGGYQIMSLGELRRIDDDGAVFVSHLDGTRHVITPEKTMEIQGALGSDIAMVLDECVAYPIGHDEAARSAQRSLRWATRCLEAASPNQAVFGIVQGSIYPEVRAWHAEALSGLPFAGFALGGLAVGEPRDATMATIRQVAPLLPDGAPRYVMGMGPPEDILEVISVGIDMFDCVVPTRNGRRGTAYTSQGKIIVKNASHARCDAPLDPACPCPVCRTYSRAYLRHLFVAGELLGPRLVSLHNVSFFVRMMSDAREAIIEGGFVNWKAGFLEAYRRDHGGGASDSATHE